jgi:vacuolar-type H+-ATPase subunit E/Vma4
MINKSRIVSADTGVATSLEPVRATLLADANAEAERIVREATRSADRLVNQAEHDADAEVVEVERRGEASARALDDQHVARARDEAHSIIMRTQEIFHQQLAEAVRDAALDLRNDPRYPALLDHFADVARNQLGDAAIIERDPEPGRGIIAVAGTRRVDYTLPALADRALDALSDETAALWS